MKAGFVHLNGDRCTMTSVMDVGKEYRLEIRFPNGVNITQPIRLTRPVLYRARNNTPDKRFHKP